MCYNAGIGAVEVFFEITVAKRREQVLNKISISAALLLVIIYAAVTAFSFAQYETETPGITVISDAPQPSPIFSRFFYFFNQTLIQWWQSGGRTNTRGKWTVSVSEFYNEDSQPRGVTIIVTRLNPPRRMMLNRQFTDGISIADIVIAVIKITTEEGQK